MTKVILSKKMVKSSIQTALGRATQFVSNANAGFRARSNIIIGNHGVAQGGIGAFIKHSQQAQQNQIAHLNRIGNAFRAFRGRRVLDLEDVPNSFLGFEETEEINGDEVLEDETVLEAQTQGFFKKLFKGVGKFFKKNWEIFQKYI